MSGLAYNQKWPNQITNMSKVMPKPPRLLLLDYNLNNYVVGVTKAVWCVNIEILSNKSEEPFSA